MKEIQKAVIEKEGKFLVLLRSPQTRYFPEHWDFPGGKLEPGEEPQQGIIREIREETDLIIEPLQIVGVFEIDLDNAGYNTHKFTVYSTKLISGTVRLSNEHTAFAWVTKEKLEHLKVEKYLELFLKLL